MPTQKMVVGVAFAVVALVMASTVLALLQSSQTITNNGAVKAIGVGVYSDVDCTQVVSSISWGTLDPGAVAVRTIYVRNQGSVSIVLNMTTNSWNPSVASSYISLTWDKQGSVVPAGGTVQANLTLSISQTVTGVTNFTFTVVIAGTQ